VLENAVNPKVLNFSPNKIKAERIRFGWIGGICHFADLLLLSDCITKFYSDLPLYNKAQLVLGGFNLNQQTLNDKGESVPLLLPYQEWYRFERIFTSDYRFLSNDYIESLHEFKDKEISKDEPYRRIWAKDVFTYGTMYNELDISLVPLEANKFNSCKSELKIIESGFMKTPVIVSAVQPYTSICNLKNSHLVQRNRNHKDWIRAMKYFVNNPSAITDMGEAIYETVKDKYHIETVNKKRVQVWEELTS
jgi:hypothetical protein